MKKATLQELLVLAYPIVISQGAFAVMIFTDRYFMSLISPTHMAASLGGGVASFFCMSLFIGILSYTNALVAQYFGHGQLVKCPRVVTQGMFLCVFFVPLLLLTGYLASDLFVLMGHDAEQAILERRYFIILICGAAVVSLPKTCIASYFSGIGQSSVVMIADTIGIAINIPLSYVLIFGLWGLPEMGIGGAAYGTIISSIISLGIYCYFYFESRHSTEFSIARSFRLDIGILRRFIRLGFPSGMEMFLNVAAFNLFLLMFQSYGIAQAASAAIVFNWDIVSFIPMIGLNVAIISLVGRYIGAGNPDRMREVIHAGFVTGIGYSSVLAIVFLVWREPLVAVFLTDATDESPIFTLSTFMMTGLAAYVMADAITLISGGVLRGAGDTRWLMWAAILIHWLMLAGQYFVIVVWDMGAKTSWVCFVVMVLATGFIYLIRLSSKGWRTPEALQRMMAEH